MITAQRITTTDAALYRFMERVLVESFPPEERRSLSALRRITDEQASVFHLYIVLDGDLPVGFYNYWLFSGFCYAEHLAIAPEYRNRKYGTQLITSLTSRFSLPLVIEVEPPASEITCRRIGFYERLGFRLWQRDYLQPPYSPEHDFLPLKLMSFREIDLSDDEIYHHVCSSIYQEVYGYRGECKRSHFDL
ncbi:MAG: GNAT family N-acetyltransferase [Prevotellaceae bacterium]|jgi:GNAT superfamily N-acetyltransferase|nr:GNAT family N-acetyltransferase [Prevotellaceae bacterium]